MTININPIYSIGDMVKAYNNIITLEGVQKELEITIGKIKRILVERDILTKDYVFLYELDNGEVFYEENLMRVLN